MGARVGSIIHFSFPPITIMSSSSSYPSTTPLIVGGDPSEGTQVPIVPNWELRQGAFCIVNPDFWGAGDRGTFNGTVDYTGVCLCFLILSQP